MTYSVTPLDENGHVPVSEDSKQTSGGIPRVPVVEDEVASLLGKILLELKKMNLHLESITEEKISYNDVEA